MRGRWVCRGTRPRSATRRGAGGGGGGWRPHTGRPVFPRRASRAVDTGDPSPSIATLAPRPLLSAFRAPAAAPAPAPVGGGAPGRARQCLCRVGQWSHRRPGLFMSLLCRRRRRNKDCKNSGAKSASVPHCASVGAAGVSGERRGAGEVSEPAADRRASLQSDCH